MADKREQHTDNQDSCHAKSNGGEEAHATVDVQRYVAVIPPVSVKQLFQSPGSEVLKNNTSKKANKEKCIF